jgi:hypothetical protein
MLIAVAAMFPRQTFYGSSPRLKVHRSARKQPPRLHHRPQSSW